MQFIASATALLLAVSGASAGVIARQAPAAAAAPAAPLSAAAGTCLEPFGWINPILKQIDLSKVDWAKVQADAGPMYAAIRPQIQAILKASGPIMNDFKPAWANIDYSKLGAYESLPTVAVAAGQLPDCPSPLGWFVPVLKQVDLKSLDWAKIKADMRPLMGAFLPAFPALLAASGPLMNDLKPAFANIDFSKLGTYDLTPRV